MRAWTLGMTIAWLVGAPASAGCVDGAATPAEPLAPNAPTKESGPITIGYTADTYDTAVLAALAIERAGTADDAAKVRDALYDVSSKGTAFGPGGVGEALAAIQAGTDIDYDGASGPVDLDDGGDVIAGYIVNVAKAGKIVELPAETIGVETLEWGAPRWTSTTRAWRSRLS
jgi:hypothetical protein